MALSSSSSSSAPRHRRPWGSLASLCRGECTQFLPSASAEPSLWFNKTIICVCLSQFQLAWDQGQQTLKSGAPRPYQILCVQEQELGARSTGLSLGLPPTQDGNMCSPIGAEHLPRSHCTAKGVLIPVHRLALGHLTACSLGAGKGLSDATHTRGCMGGFALAGGRLVWAGKQVPQNSSE